MGKELAGDAALEKIRSLIKGIDIGMFTTRGTDDHLRARPMSSNSDVSEDGTLWFFTRRDSRLANEIEEDPAVLISFSNPAKHEYVSVFGAAQIVEDKKICEKHWKPELRAWFPAGLQDPEVTLIQVVLEEGEYWDAHSQFLAQTMSFARGLIGGRPLNTTEHGTVKASKQV